MTKEEMIAFIKENLEISLTVEKEDYGYEEDKSMNITVKLLLSGEEVSTSSSWWSK